MTREMIHTLKQGRKIGAAMGGVLFLIFGLKVFYVVDRKDLYTGGEEVHLDIHASDVHLADLPVSLVLYEQHQAEEDLLLKTCPPVKWARLSLTWMTRSTSRRCVNLC